MDRWISGIRDVVQILLGNPGPSWEYWLLLLLSVGVAILTFGKLSDAMNIPNAGMARSFFVVGGGILFVVWSVTAARLYVSGFDIRLTMAVAVVVASLALVVPLVCITHKTGYVSALVVWGASLGAAALVILLVGAGLDMFLSGGHEAKSLMMQR